MTLSIAPLGEGDIDAICALAREIWRRHYPPIIGTAQTEYMLAQRYTSEVIRAELAREDLWWDTLAEDGAFVAFASSLWMTPERTLKLDKLYVHPERQRLGYGAALIEHTCDRARRLGCERVVLAVNKHNDGAIAAYRRLGFDVADAIVKDIGGGFVMDDYIMVRRV